MAGLAVPPHVRAACPAGWQVEAVAGDAGALHALEVPARRLVRAHSVQRPALVMGSTQVADVVTGTLARGVEVARRRSGGGAVWLEPGEQVWVDVVIPAGDPQWRDDVGLAPLWLGEAWASLGADLCGPATTRVWRDGMHHREFGRIACFAGLGPGEVTLEGRKLVGISQRRTRHAARFQCVVHLRWNPEPLLAALAPVPDALAERLRSDVVALGTEAVNRLDSADPAGDSPGGAWWGVVARLLAVLP